MNKILIILLAGILLRLFLAFSTIHSDLTVFHVAGKVIGEGHIFNLYDYSSDAATFNYPPLIYWFFGIFNFLSNWGIWLLKLPYLIFDLSLGLLLYKVVEEKRKALVFGLWMFNPISLYATYMMGQFDIIPAFFTMLSFYLVVQKKLKWSALALGFGIAFKLYPVFLLIPLLIIAKSFITRIKLVLIAALPYFISVLPYLSSESFRSNALFASQSSKSLYAGIQVSGGESILLFPFFLLLFYLYIWNNQSSGINLWKVFLIPLLLFFIFTHYHPQWLIWVTPFLVLDLSFERFKNLLPIFLMIITWIASLFFFDPSLTIGIFSPLFPALKNITLNINADYNFSRSILQTVFASSAFYLVFKTFPRKIND
ncbi:hypothetical protein A3H81_00390 [Candidatus Daviesbacteria bacterium RIFCSPLOWO2_02_FULL_38_18]|nr:MAG: hypothetical protein A3H81_00390 [Candidatus Daviesbacteria bacterium RIFCSPLOWO2_02_FULL_38_18]OGE72988.1 MAG: hypothetical protein A3H18_00275 [Candidatus Daviesbacteria bacterium RIFCSPLOWO2_12_FULL_38_10]HCB23200.1 hypothetical protein [Candidatus Daviesbacteria bacterium]